LNAYVRRLVSARPAATERARAEGSTEGSGEPVPSAAAVSSARNLPGKRYLDWDSTDLKGRSLEEVRATRDEIARRVDAAPAASGTHDSPTA
jgi:hypothetical protein